MSQENSDWASALGESFDRQREGNLEPFHSIHVVVDDELTPLSCDVFTEEHPNYGALREVLAEAMTQACKGKGAERHGQDLPFEMQPMQSISDLVGSPDGLSYQAIKKVQEAIRLPTTKQQVHELLGAINYIAGIVIYLRRHDVHESK